MGVQLLNRPVSTHMPLARHDTSVCFVNVAVHVSTHMPLARHDDVYKIKME